MPERPVGYRAGSSSQIVTRSSPARVAATAAMIATALLVAGCAREPRSLPAAPPDPARPTVSPYASGVTTAADVFGPGCNQLPDGNAPGSVTAMASMPLGAAVSSNPQLTVLAGALRKANLTDRLNRFVAATLFAPTNEAFAHYRDRIGEQRYNDLMANPAHLADVLNYHVLVDRYDRKRLLAAPESGLATLFGGTLKIQPKDDTMSLTDGARNDAAVVCGNLPTSNGTIFMIDGLLQAAQPGALHRSAS